MYLLASLPLLSLAAASLERRDAATVTSVLSGISSQINAVDTIVKAYTGGSIDSLSAASAKLLGAITSGTATIKGSAPLSDADAGTIAQSVITLNTSTAAVVDDLIAKKSLFDSQSPPAGGVILKSLQDQASASADFATALTALTPSDLQAVASSLSAAIAANLARGVAAFQSDANLPPPTSSGGSPPPHSSTGAGSPPPTSSGGAAPTGGAGGNKTATGTPPPSSSSSAAGGAPTTSCATTTSSSGANAPNGTLSVTQTPPAQYTAGSGAGAVGMWGGAAVGAVALVPVFFL
jgi:hypothetical protein